MRKKQNTRKSVQTGWGLNVGALVYKPFYWREGDWVLGKIVNIWEGPLAMTCDIYWFGSSTKHMERDCPISNIRCASGLKKNTD